MTRDLVLGNIEATDCTTKPMPSFFDPRLFYAIFGSLPNQTTKSRSHQQTGLARLQPLAVRHCLFSLSLHVLKVQQVLETARTRAPGSGQVPLLLVRQGRHRFNACVGAGPTFSVRRVDGARDAGSTEGLGEGWVRGDKIDGLGAGGKGHLTRG